MSESRPVSESESELESRCGVRVRCECRIRVMWMQRLAEPESDVAAETSRAKVRCGTRVTDQMQSQS